MTPLLSNKIQFSVLILSACSASFGATLPETAVTECTKISPTIVADLNDFSKLIDPAILAGIVAEHVLLDRDFRKAMEFVEKKDFMKFMEKLQNVPEVQDILNYLQILVPCKKLELDVPLLDIVLLEAMENEKNYEYHHQQRRSLPSSSDENSSSSEYEVNSLASFLEEVLKELPKTKYSNLIKEKCAKSNEFKTFYTLLRNPIFKQKVDSALKSKNLEPFLKELGTHRIDPISLEPTMLKLISWGPKV